MRRGSRGRGACAPANGGVARRAGADPDVPRHQRPARASAVPHPGVVNLKVGNTRVWSGRPPPVVRALIAAGWEIDAHTITHPDLTTVDAARLRHEVAGSRTWIRRKFRVPVDFFCYPFGGYDARA